MIILLVLIALSSFAQDQSVEEYCFSSPARMKQVHQKLKFILVPADKTQEENECFTVNSPSHRRELIHNYVRKLDPAVRIGFSSAEVKRETCSLKVETVRSTHEQDIQADANISLVQGKAIPQIKGSASQSQKGGNTTMSIKTIKDFEFTVNQDVIKGECRHISPSRYEISLEVRKDAVPLTPPLPPGTIVNIPDSQLGKVQDTAKLQTTLQLNSGERIEVGSMVKNLKGSGKQADIQSGAAINNKDNLEEDQVFLSID